MSKKTNKTSKIFGYCRVSTKRQSLSRQEENILSEYPNADIRKEQYTGTKIEGRDEFNKLLSELKEGDTVVFDSVSRMSRNKEEGVELYEKLYNKGIKLIFLKENYINTSILDKAVETSNGIDVADGTNVMKTVNTFMKDILLSMVKDQVAMAFEQSEKEVKDLQKRTAEGIREARRKAKDEGREFNIGAKKGVKRETQKGREIKETILKYSRDFNGQMLDKEIMEWKGWARNTYYNHKRELLNQHSQLNINIIS